MTGRSDATTAADDSGWYDPMSELWRFRENRCSETAHYRMGRYEAECFDYDGDRADWWVKRDGEEIARGDTLDFREAIRQVEMVLYAQKRLCIPEGRFASELSFALYGDEKQFEEGGA